MEERKDRNAAQKSTFRFFLSRDLYLFIHSISAAGQGSICTSGHTQGASPLPYCPKKLLSPTSAQAKNYSTCSTFLFWDGLNHFQLPKKLRCLTDGFKALSFMVHYQDLVNRNRLFLPACENAAECFISGNAAYKYDSVILWHRTSRNCFPLCKLAMLKLFWT